MVARLVCYYQQVAKMKPKTHVQVERLIQQEQSKPGAMARCSSQSFCLVWHHRLEAALQAKYGIAPNLLGFLGCDGDGDGDGGGSGSS